MSSIQITPPELQAQGKTFKTKYSDKVRTVLDNIAIQEEIIAGDWKGQAAGSNIPILTETANRINVIGHLAYTIGNNIELAAQHAAKRDEDAAINATKGWGVVATVENYAEYRLLNPRGIITNVSLGITDTSNSAVEQIMKIVTDLPLLIDEMKTSFEAVITNAGWTSGYENIKDVIFGEIAQAKTVVNSLQENINKVITVVKKSIEDIKADAVITSSATSSGPANNIDMKM